MWSDASLLSDEFDDEAYLRHALHLPSFDSEQSRLNKSVELVQHDIRQLISQDADVLLTQVDAASAAEKEVSAFRNSVGTLKASVKRMKHTIEDPFDLVSSKVTEMQNTVTAIETLRLLQRFLALVQKMPELVNSDISRAARNLRDIEDTLSTSHLQGVDAAERQLDAVTKFSASIRSKAHEMLKTSMATQNQAELAVALQCFFSLGTLQKVIGNMIAEHKREFTKLVMRELDAQAAGQLISDSASGESGKATKDALFTKLETVMSDGVLRATSVLLVWKVLMKKKDPVTHELFLDAIDDRKHLLGEFWGTLSSQISEKIQKLCKRGNIFLLLVSEYPRLYHAVKSFVNSTQELFSAMGDAKAGERWASSTLHEAEQKFVSLSQEKHRDKLQQITTRLATLIPSGGAESITVDVFVDPARPALPSNVTALDVKGLLKLINQEMSLYRQDKHVLGLVVGQAYQSLTLLTQRLKESLAKVPQQKGIAFPTTCSATSGQVFQFCIVNAISSICVDVTNALSVLPSESSAGGDQDSLFLSQAAKDLKEVHVTLQALAKGVIGQYFAAASASLSSSVAAAVEEVQSDSAFQQLTVRVGSFVSRFVLLLDRSTPGVEDEEKKIVETLLKRIVLHSTLVRPLDAGTAAHLQKCLTQVPQIVLTIPHLPESSLATWRNQVKALKSLLNHSAEDLDLLQSHLPHINPIVALLHLAQTVPLSYMPSLPQLSKLTNEQCSDILLDEMNEVSELGRKLKHSKALEWLSVGFREYESVALHDSTELKRKHQHIEMFSRVKSLLK